MTITVKFVGSLRHVSGVNELALAGKKCLSVREMMIEISGELPELKQSIVEPQLETLQTNALILVNGIEISVLNGLETKVKDGDEIVLVPVVHGG